MTSRLLKKFFLTFLLLCLFFPRPGAVHAQDEIPSLPVYVVQSGDTLWDIARRFGISLEDLMQANNITDASIIKAGDELAIPGLEGVQGRLNTRALSYGESLRGLSRMYDLPVDTITRLNRIVSPAELYVGEELILPENVQPQEESSSQGLKRAMIFSGQSTLEFAVLNNLDPWSIPLVNKLRDAVQVLPGDVLMINSQDVSEAESSANALPGEILEVSLNRVPWVQGKTAEIQLWGSNALSMSGTFLGHDFPFFQQDDGKWVALQGIHALTDIGLYPLSINLEREDGSTWSFSQKVQVASGNYPYDPELIVDPATIDPQVTDPENKQWTALAAPITNDKLWDGLFSIPVESVFSDCLTSRYGNRRSYNNSGYLYFHTGLDFCGAVGNSIFAPASGEVVFAGPLTVRGNATMINHGWGVYTAYMHQSEILVSVGDYVEAGQQIGKVGGTGRVNGPHLHLEVWVGGVQVDPEDWLQEIYP